MTAINTSGLNVNGVIEMSSAGDDDELTFEEIEEPEAETPKAETVAADANAPAATAAEAAPDKAARDEAKDKAASDKPVETPARKRPPLAGIFLAAALVLCLLTSSLAAWKASSAASALSHQAQAENKPRALDARLASIERLLEQQRDLFDEMSAKPVQAAGGENAQITALATAVRASQEMSERIPALVASAVQARVGQVARADRPTGAAPAKAGAKPRFVKPIARLQQVAARAPIAPPALPPPPGDAIRYP